MTKENADKDGGEFLRKEDSGPTEKEWKVLKERSRKRGQSGGNKREKQASRYFCREENRRRYTRALFMKYLTEIPGAEQA